MLVCDDGVLVVEGSVFPRCVLICADVFRGKMSCCVQLTVQCSGEKGSSYIKEKCLCIYIYRYIHRICTWIEVFMCDVYVYKYDICVYTYICTNMCVCMYLHT